jgi:hypothetical protein
VGNPQTVRVAATRLAYASLPGNVVVSQDFSVAVQAQDANGNVDADATAAVSLALAAGAGALSGSLNNADVGCRFEGLRLTRLGTVVCGLRAPDCPTR